MKITATLYHKLTGIFLLLLLITGLTQSSQAAFTGYRFTVGTGTAADMTGATNIWVGVAQTRFHAPSGVINIGFPFQFDGVNYTQMQVYTSGALSLGNGTLFRYSFNNLNTPTDPVIAPFWDSLAMTGTQGGCFAPKIRYKLFGSAPNRMLVVEWFDQETIWGRGSRGTFQARLYETSGKIEFYYQSMNHCVTCGTGIGLCGNSSASIGLASGSNNFISVTPNTLTATASTGTANNAINLNTVTTQIGPNVLYTFSPNIQLAVQEALDFGQVTAGVTTTRCITVRNVGTVGQLLFPQASIAPTGEYTVASLPSVPVMPGDTNLVCVSINASSTGPFSATLTITSNGLDSGTQDVALMATAVRPQIEIIPLENNTATQLFRLTNVRLQDSVEQCFLVKNNGPGQLLVSQSSFIDGAFPAYYRISRFPMLLDSGMSDSMCVVFRPQEEGGTFADLHIISNASNGTQDMQLRGAGIRPCIVVNPNLISFDSVIIGDTICKQIFVENPCTDTLYLQAITLSSDPDFYMNPLLKRDSIIPPGQSRFITVCFRPLARGTRSGRIVFFTNIPRTFESPSRDTSIYYVDLGGTGVPIGRLYADIEGLGLTDSTLIGKTICRQDTIFNIGEGDFLITQAFIRGADSADYTLTGITPLPYLLRAQSFVVATICAKPSERAVSLGQLYIAGHTDGIGDTLVATLSVKGLLACAERDPAELFMLDTVYTGTTDSALVKVVNCGDIPASYTATIVGPDASEYSVTPTTTGLIAPGDSTFLTVYFHPTTRGAKSATLRLTAPDITTMTVQLGGFSGCAVLVADATVEAPRTKTGLTNPIEFWVVITNNGNIDWNVGTPVVTPSTVFAFVPTGSATVIPTGGTDSIKISFHPNDSTMFTARITFPGSGPCAEVELRVDLVGEGFHDAAVRDIHAIEGYVLEQNTPNPTTGMTTFRYTVPTSSSVRIILADVTGKLVRELVNDRVASGTHEVQVATQDLPSGTYIYIMEAGRARLVRQLVVTK